MPSAPRIENQPMPSKTMPRPARSDHIDARPTPMSMSHDDALLPSCQTQKAMTPSAAQIRPVVKTAKYIEARTGEAMRSLLRHRGRGPRASTRKARARCDSIPSIGRARAPAETQGRGGGFNSRADSPGIAGGSWRSVGAMPTGPATDRAAPRSRPRLTAAVLGGLFAAAIAAASLESSAPVALAADGPDYGFFKERIEPVLQSVCAQCHAGKGQGQFALVVHAVGAPFPEPDHQTNFATVQKLLVPGKPDQSKFLLKPLAKKDGGVKHGGGDRIFKDTPAYKNWVGFINGERGSVASAETAAGSPPGQPDFGFFLEKIEPVLQSVCSQCHAGTGKGQFALITHTGGTRFPLEDHRKNFETVSRLLVPGKPDQSKFLLKPLFKTEGGIKHGGGDRIAKADANYKSWVDFINGVKGAPPPADVAAVELPKVTEKGLVLQAEDMQRGGDATVVDLEGGGGKAVAPGAGGGSLVARFVAPRPADYAVTLRVGKGTRPLRLRIDGGEFVEVDSPVDAVADVAPRLILDGGKSVEGRRGKLTVDGTSLAMDGRGGVARFLASADLAHTRIEATIATPPLDDPALDDAWLLFDCGNTESGHFFGLSDAGRKVVMGVIDAGRPRVVKSVPRPEGAAAERLSVEFQSGVAIGRLDGKPLLYVNFDDLQAGRFGFLTHGTMTVKECVAKHGAEEVYRFAPSVGGVFSLRRREHEIE